MDQRAAFSIRKLLTLLQLSTLNVLGTVGMWWEMVSSQETVKIFHPKTPKVVLKRMLHCQSIKTPTPNEETDSDNSEGALILWKWNGLTKLPISALPLYDRPFGIGF